MSKKKPQRKPRPDIELHDGSIGKAPLRMDFWFDGREKHPSPFGRGFPYTEEGGKAMKLIMFGHCYKIGCFNRVTGRYNWTIQRGDRIPGTRLYNPIITRGAA